MNNLIARSNIRPIAIDLYAGAGGMSLGFEMAGFDIAAAVDIDPIHCATHEFNYPHTPVICASTIDLTGVEIRSRSQIGDRPIDVVFGGPPCQGFSLMGKRQLEDPRNDLIKHFFRLVVELQPKYFVMENVKGITLKKHKQLLNELIQTFIYNDYTVEEDYQILNAANYGVPQNRERLFLIGCKQGLDLPKYPQKETTPKNAKPQLNLPFTPTVFEAIADIPEVNDYPKLNKKDWVKAEYGKPSSYAAKLRGLEDRDWDFSYPRIWDNRILTSSLNTEHTRQVITRFSNAPQDKQEPISRFFKLAPDGISTTLRAGTGNGKKGAFTAPRPIHYSSPRCITVREGARLHSYPDWFRFHSTKWHGFRQVGNSVPPLLARAIAQEIIKVLNVDPVKPTFQLKLGSERLLNFTVSEAARYYQIID